MRKTRNKTARPANEQIAAKRASWTNRRRDRPAAAAVAAQKGGHMSPHRPREKNGGRPLRK
jgi:hypothetical protein